MGKVLDFVGKHVARKRRRGTVVGEARAGVVTLELEGSDGSKSELLRLTPDEAEAWGERFLMLARAAREAK